MTKIIFAEGTRQAATFGIEAVLCEVHRAAHEEAISGIAFKAVLEDEPCIFCELEKRNRADCLRCMDSMDFATECCGELVCHECDDACPTCGKKLWLKGEQ